MPFKDISYLELWGPICSADQNRLCNLVEQFCEIILNLNQWFKRKCSGSPFVKQSRTICAILVEGFTRNNSVK